MYRDRLGVPSRGRLPGGTYHRRVRIDLNADVGEWIGDGPARATDAALLPLVTSVNVACGAHAGDDASMAVTVALAADQGLAIGAHPGYPDREGFGRRQLDLTPDELRATLTEQLERLAAVCSARGIALTHVKAHGALYNAAANDPELARIVAGAPSTPSTSGWRCSGHRAPRSSRLPADAGLRSVAEGFADRSYEPDGTPPAALARGRGAGHCPSWSRARRSISRRGRA